MILDLVPVAACLATATGTMLARRPGRAGISGVLNTLAEGRGKAVLERERRSTMALILRELPPGMCAAGRDAAGREWFIGPAVIAHVRGSKEAIGDHVR